MSSPVDRTFNVRMELARDLLQPQPGHDLLERLELVLKFMQSEFAREIPRTGSSSNLDHLVRHHDLSRRPSLDQFPSYDTSTKQDPDLKNCKDMFQLLLNVPQFIAKEIDVKVVGGFIVIHGKHDRLSDGHGWVVREFTRRYKIPVDVESSTLRSIKNKYGYLVITASKNVIQPTVAKERKIPVELEKEG